MDHLSTVISKLTIPVCILIGIGLSACSHTSETIKSTPDSQKPLDYTVIYYIHADADYLFHDGDGQAVRSNSQVLETAKSVAGNAVSGEVFVFYQRPAKKILGLFPRRTSTLHHYVNGQKKREISYYPVDQTQTFLSMEARLYNQYRSTAADNISRYFLYYGHEIPGDSGKGYHHSRPDITVNTAALGKGIEDFLSAEPRRFDLVVLSTCNNGTPAVARQLNPHTDYLLASPQNLHLSHIDSEPMGLLEESPGITTQKLAHSLADQTYERLTKKIHTAITLSVYDFETVRSYISDLYAFTSANKTAGDSNYGHGNTDCARHASFEEGPYDQGVKVWFRPAKFGRNTTRQHHSGWGCIPP